MSGDLLVVGSVAIDAVETPFGREDEALGGSALYFTAAASLFAPVRLVAVIGEDFPTERVAFLAERGADLSGLVRAPGKTFRWKGRYGFDLNEAHTLETHLNVFEGFSPELAPAHRACPYVFLANIDPDLQQRVLDQVEDPRFVALDTMNFWIEGKRRSLLEAVARVDMVVLNEAEARMLAEEPNLVRAAQKILSWGPKGVVVKRGEYGAMYFADGHVFAAPAFPLEEVFDPTGAGDTFAGGMMGYLASTGNLEPDNIRRAIVFGSAMASFNVEDFSFRRLERLTYDEVASRYRQFKTLTQFEAEVG
ncbi:PfkB family carbohydrate kinase [Deferrisoma camini]|uniref:PfkB family carbohydrate kinase n=1 Tax=Deferrisoma camini TaxID=1035120 RepID=UPI0004A3E04C|nr:PfkB family carbohydrate kinase [Deferrisoma camini]